MSMVSVLQKQVAILATNIATLSTKHSDLQHTVEKQGRELAEMRERVEDSHRFTQANDDFSDKLHGEIGELTQRLENMEQTTRQHGRFIDSGYDWQYMMGGSQQAHALTSSKSSIWDAFVGAAITLRDAGYNALNNHKFETEQQKRSFDHLCHALTRFNTIHRELRSRQTQGLLTDGYSDQKLPTPPNDQPDAAMRCPPWQP